MSAIDSQTNDFISRSLKATDFKVFPLAGDASTRRYFRVVQGQTSWVLMNWEPFNPKEYPFLSVLNHFQASGVRVPHVVGMDPAMGLVLLEDLGDLTLERKFWESRDPKDSLVFFQMAIDQM